MQAALQNSYNLLAGIILPSAILAARLHVVVQQNILLKTAKRPLYISYPK